MESCKTILRLGVQRMLSLVVGNSFPRYVCTATFLPFTTFCAIQIIESSGVCAALSPGNGGEVMLI